MALSSQSVVGLANDLIAEHDKTLLPDEHHGLIRRYLAGDHDLPYMPKGAKREYQLLAERSITNWLPLVSDTFAKTLFVDGYRAGSARDNAKPWSYWQANGLDARQTVIHRGALEYGASYTLVLPGSPAPLIRPLKPTRVLAFFEDEDDEWPVYGIIRKGTQMDGSVLYDVLDRTAIYSVAKDSQSNGGAVRFLGARTHAFGVTPLVRFRDQLGGNSEGIILPLKSIQDRINEAVFSLGIALQYASFRQRWATGLAVPVDEETGEPVEPFQAAVDRLWVTDSPDAKFGDFAQTETSGHLRAYESAVKSLAAIAQTSPHVLTGDLNNLSADALAVVEASTTRKASEYETVFGESWEQTLRLAALADGDRENAADTSAQVRWRDSEARSLSQTVDALGKMAQMLQVPAEGLWERIPGVTDNDIEAWKEIAGRTDGLAALTDALLTQSADTGTAPVGLGEPTEV